MELFFETLTTSILLGLNPIVPSTAFIDWPSVFTLTNMFILLPALYVPEDGDKNRVAANDDFGSKRKPKNRAPPIITILVFLYPFFVFMFLCVL